MKALIITALLVALSALQAETASTPATEINPEAKAHYQDDSQVEAVHDVLEAYKIALKALDRTAFRALFHSPKAPIYGIYVEDESADTSIYEHASDFIDRFIKEKRNPYQEFWNIDIRVDGLVAVLTSDFSFHVDGQKTNWGTESWHLVKTSDSWKILSIIYSVKP